MRQDCSHFDKMAWDRTAFTFWRDGMRQDCIHFYDKIVWDRTAFIFMTRLYETALHSFLWQDCMRPVLIHFWRQASIRPVLIHFEDKPAKDRYSSIFKTSQNKTGTRPFLRQASIRPVLIHFTQVCIYTSVHIFMYIYILLRRNVYVFFKWDSRCTL